jgi:hypothetical protein
MHTTFESSFRFFNYVHCNYYSKFNDRILLPHNNSEICSLLQDNLNKLKHKHKFRYVY